jgi:hypothetical protein
LAGGVVGPQFARDGDVAGAPFDLELAGSVAVAAQNYAGARSSNATASRTAFGEETDRAIAPYKVDSALYNSMVDEQEALNAPRKLAGDANKADAEGRMAQEEAALPPDKRRGPGYKPASETIKAEEGTNAVKTREAALDAVLQYSQIIEGKEGAPDNEKITYPNSDGEEVTSTVGAIRKKIKLNRKRAAEAQARISSISGGGQDAPASGPQQTSPRLVNDFDTAVSEMQKKFPNKSREEIIGVINQTKRN